MERGGCVYIITNKSNKVFYVGVSSNLRNRIIDHKEKKYPKSFSARYNLFKLVYFESYSSIIEAIEKEKYLKGKTRNFKIALIEEKNKNWIDLYQSEVIDW